MPSDLKTGGNYTKPPPKKKRKPAAAPQGEHAVTHPTPPPPRPAPPSRPAPKPVPRRPATPIVTEHTHGQAHPAVKVFHQEDPRLYHKAYQRNAPFAIPGPYQTTLAPQQERAFRQWVAAHHVPFDPKAKTVDYDMRGYWAETGGRAWKPGQHFPDTHKTPYDTTFSRESKFATAHNPFAWHGNNLVDTRSGQVIFSPPKTAAQKRVDRGVGAANATINAVSRSLDAVPANVRHAHITGNVNATLDAAISAINSILQPPRGTTPGRGEHAVGPSPPTNRYGLPADYGTAEKSLTNPADLAWLREHARNAIGPPSPVKLGRAALGLSDLATGGAVTGVGDLIRHPLSGWGGPEVARDAQGNPLPLDKQPINAGVFPWGPTGAVSGASKASRALSRAGEPRLKAGHVRLYRGEGEGYLSYEDQGLIPDESSTEWFSADREFAAQHDTGGGLWYVDVPKAVALEHVAPDMGLDGVHLPSTFAAKAQELPPAVAPAARGSRRATRILKHEGLEVPIPGAKSSLVGRPIEAIADSLRDTVAKPVGTLSMAQKAGDEVGRTARNLAKADQAPALALKKAARYLSKGQQYALRVLGEGKSVEDRIAHHAAQAELVTDPAQKAYHAIHIAILKSAQKWVGTDAEDNPFLRPGAPGKLKESWRLLQVVAAKRESIYTDLAQLSDDQIMGRIHGPGRVVAGARFLHVDEANAQIRELDKSLRRIAARKDEIKRQIKRALKGSPELTAAKAENVKANAAAERGSARRARLAGESEDAARAANAPAERASARRAKLAAEAEGLDRAQAHLEATKEKLERLASGKDVSLADLQGVPIRRGGSATTNVGAALAKAVAEHAPGGEPLRGARVSGASSKIEGSLVDESGRVIGPDEDLILYHATDPETAAQILRDGFKPGAKPINPPPVITDPTVAKMLRKNVGDRMDYAVGHGQGDGVYLGTNPKHLQEVFGKVVLEVRIPRRNLMAAPEKNGRLSPERSLLLDDGYTTHPIPASDIRVAESGGHDLGAADASKLVADSLRGTGRPPADFALPRNKALGRVYDEAVRLQQKMDRRLAAHSRLLAENERAPELAAAQIDKGVPAAEHTAGAELATAQEGTAAAVESAKRAGVLAAQTGERALGHVTEAERELAALRAETEAGAGRIVGHEDYAGGVIRVPFVRGVPTSFRGRAAQVGGYLQRSTHLFGGGGRSAIGVGPIDKTTNHAYTGSGLITGLFKAGRGSVTNAAADDLILASRLGLAAKLRPELLKASTELPRDITDIPIKIDPKVNSAQEVQRLYSRMESIEANGEKMDLSELKDINPNLVLAAQEGLFPVSIAGEDAATIAQNLMRNIGDAKPIPNIRWINRGFLERSELLYVPKAQRLQSQGLRKIAAGGGGLWDGFNDIMKSTILFLSPAYGPVNLLGNLAMNVMQQGVFILPNMYRAAKMSFAMAPEERLYADSIMGHGLTGSLTMRTNPGRILGSTLGHWIGLAVDLLPRRAAFLHELRNAGYGTTSEVRDLLKRGMAGDTQAQHELDQIGRVANDAIVDYERLSPFERDKVARVFFFYPWTKGATRYSLRFLADHPYQMAALGLMAEHAKETADEDLGPRPYYEQFTVPITTRALGLSVPGTDLSVGLDQAVGDRTWKDAQGRPMAENLRQLLTQSTPLQLGEAAGAFFSVGPKGAAKELVQNLTPLPYTLAVSLFGYDPFKSKEVPVGAGTFLNESTTGFPIQRAIDNLTMSDQERAARNLGALHPRSKGQDIAATFFGGLTPSPYDKAVGTSRAKGRVKALHGGAKVHEWEAHSTKVKGYPPDPDIVRARVTREVYESQQKRLMDELGIKGPHAKLTAKQKTAVKLEIAIHDAGLDPSYRQRLLDARDESDLEYLDGLFERALKWPSLERYNEQVNRMDKRDKAAKKEAAAHG